MRILAPIAAASAVLVASACLKSPTDPAPSSPTPGGQRVSVTKMYEDNCANCHGQQGQGGGAGTKSLNTTEKFDQSNDRKFFDTIKKGRPDQGMVAFDTLSDQQIWSLVVHIREMQAKALRAEKGSPKAVDGVYRSQRHNFKIETVIDNKQGLRTPWAIDWLPSGQMLITNRPGDLMIFENGQPKATVKNVPAVLELGQGGLMEVAVHPNYATNSWIYLAYSEPAREKGGAALTKIVRGKLAWNGSDATWTGQETIWEADQKFYNGAGIHFGSRIVFDGKGHIFFAVGERGGNMLAQEITNPFGKIYRLNEDGSEPKDNPFVGKEGAIKGIWTLGHRNPQALTFDSEGRLWDTEHGPRGGDEVNEITKGSNYGWPVIAHSINYNDTPFQVPWNGPDQNFKLPVFRWLPSIGACGMDTMRGPAFPKWNGDLFAGGLSGANVDRIRVKGGQLVEREEIIHGMGRVREVATGHDGCLYVALNQPDVVIKVSPAP